MNRISLLLGLLTFALHMNAQNFGEIHGKVLFEDGSAVPGANVFVELLSGVKSANTDTDGNFRIKPLEPTTYMVVTSFVGYHNDTVRNVVVHPNKINRLRDITLIEDSKVINEVEITAVAGPKLIDPEETGLTTVTYDQIKSNPLLKSPMKLISTLTPGVTQGSNGELYFRGSRTGAVQYHVDGVKLTTNVSAIPSSGIGSIQIYTGGIPAKYGDVTGGVVVIETKSFMDLYLKKKYSS
jgi:hypothetical protein